MIERDGPQTAVDQRPNRILILDDEAPNRRLLGRQIGRLAPGFEFLEADSPDQAIQTHLATTRGRGLALIATDYRMPGGIFGDDFARLVRGHEIRGRRLADDIVENLNRVPLVMVSGDVSLEQNFRELISQGILNHLILKPVTEEDIRNMMKSLVDRTLGNA